MRSLWRQSSDRLTNCTKPVLCRLACRKQSKKDEMLTIDLDLLWTSCGCTILHDGHFKTVSTKHVRRTYHGSRSFVTSLDNFRSLKLLHRHQYEATWGVGGGAYRLRCAFRVMMNRQISDSGHFSRSRSFLDYPSSCQLWQGVC